MTRTRTAVAHLPLLTNLALNRALLARQHLLGRSASTIPQLLEHLVGMQSQVPTDPFTGLWSRLDRFEPADLDAMMFDRSAARVPLMRGTLHLVTARDALRLRAVMRPLYDDYGSKLIAAQPGLDLDDVYAFAATALAEQPRNRKQIEALAADRYPNHSANAIAAHLQYFLPILQVPPSGTWTGPHQPAWTTIAHWLGREIDDQSDIDGTIRRYLAAFGPATVADVAAWSKLTGLRAHLERLRPTLRSFRNERGQELFDVPDGLLPGPEVPAPIRFLPEFDNALLAHADRTRIIADSHRQAIGGQKNGRFLKTWTLNGFVRGTWKPGIGRKQATLVVGALDAISADESRLAAAEADRLLAFLAPDAADRLVTFA